MVGEFDAKLSGLAAEIVRDAVQDYDRGDIARWLAGRTSLSAAPRRDLPPGGWDMASSFVSIVHAHEAVVEHFTQRGPFVPMRLLAYCLMPNHWHPVLYPRADGDLSKFPSVGDRE